MSDRISIVFMGTPDFAVPALKTLCESREGESEFDIKLVVTKPDRPRGRGLKPSPPPIKKLAQKMGLKIFQPEKIKNEEAIKTIISCNADVAVVVAFGQIIPAELLKAFPLGVINVHPSLLPKYRGAAPIQRAILNGEKESGVTIMLLDEGLDSGPILMQKAISIGKCENAGSLHDRLSTLGAKLLAETIPLLKKSQIQPLPQDESLATYAKPISKEELLINWNQPADKIIRTVRAFDPIPGAYTFWRGKRLKCFDACYSGWTMPDGKPGKILGLESGKVLIKTADDNAITIGELQLEGKKRLKAEEFVRGIKDFIGTTLG